MKKENEIDLELQIKVIEAFLEEPDYIYNYSYFEEKTGETREKIKPIIDLLKRINVVKYVRGLINEEGEVCGSGFELTYESTKLSIREWLARLKEIKTEEVVEKMDFEDIDESSFYVSGFFNDVNFRKGVHQLIHNQKIIINKLNKEKK
jgi:hypothetical protein